MASSDPGGFTRESSDSYDLARLHGNARRLDLSHDVHEIIAGIRHELANPVNSVKSALTVLRAGLDTFEREKQRDYLDRILEEVQRMEYLLRTLGGFDLGADLEMQPIDIEAFLDGLDFEPRVQRAPRATTPPACIAWADARALVQVLRNVVDNALDATANVPDPTVVVAVHGTDENVLVEVSDNGAGILEADVQRVFQPFWTNKPQGTGLGLVITKRLMTTMRGSVRLDSTPGGGTRVSLRLQRVTEP